MATEVIHTIGPNGDYSDLNAWWGDRRGNLVERDTVEIAELLPGVHEVYTNHYWDNQGDIVVDAEHYFEVRTVQGAEFKGSRSTWGEEAVLYWRTSSDYYPMFYIYNIPYFKFKRFKIQVDSLSPGWYGIYINANYCLVDGICITGEFSTGNIETTGYGILSEGYDNIIRNCVIDAWGVYWYGSQRNFLGIYYLGNYYNNFVYINFWSPTGYETGNIYGISNTSGPVINNAVYVVGYISSGEMICFTPNYHSETGNNASSDSTAPGSDSLPYIDYQAQYIPVLYSYRLKSWSPLVSAGRNLSDKGFNWDAINQTRRSDVWSIGPIEYLLFDAATTETYIIGSSGDYTTLGAALVDQKSDLIYRDIILEFKFQSGTHDNGVSLRSYLVTDSKHYVKLTAVAGAEFKGRVNDPQLAYLRSFFGHDAFSYLKNLLCDVIYCPTLSWGSCIADGCGSYNAEAYGTAIYLYSNSYYPSILRNCIVNRYRYPYSGSGIYLYHAKAYNCVVYDYGTGNQSSPRGIYGVNAESYNCAVGGRQNSSGYDFYDVSGDYNASQDNTAPGNNSLRNVNMALQFVDVDEGEFDCHLTANSVLRDAGTNLSDLGFNWDIDGDLRSGVWDIGADEYVTTGGNEYYEDVSVSGQFAALSTDGVLFVESVLTSFVLNSSVQDIIEFTEFSTVLVQFTAATQDALHGTEASSAAFQLISIGQDNLDFLENLSAIFQGAAVSTDLAESVESVSAAYTLINAISDIGDFIDNIVSDLTFASQSSDTAELSDNLQTAFEFTASVFSTLENIERPSVSFQLAAVSTSNAELLDVVSTDLYFQTQSSDYLDGVDTVRSTLSFIALSNDTTELLDADDIPRHLFIIPTP